MAPVIGQPCDEGVIRSTKKADSPCATHAVPWILAATILAIAHTHVPESRDPEARRARALSAAFLIKGKDSGQGCGGGERRRSCVEQQGRFKPGAQGNTLVGAPSTG